jgi:oxygen-independent coproporphyrinogen-3 oxidase
MMADRTTRETRYGVGEGKASASLYVHIPFCERKCIYCDFYSIETLAPMEQFLSALVREIDSYAGFAAGVTFQTLFFGGGTPSLLSPAQLRTVIDAVHSAFDIRPDAEVTVETNPGTVDPGKLAAFREAGVNRLSIGVQSFDDAELRFLGRIHNAEEAGRCIGLARDAGFDNLSMDLIYALPGQTIEQWERTLRHALALQPDHLSAYGLIVEDNTPLSKLVAAKQVSPHPPDSEAGFFEHTMSTLEDHGFEHYEISNYARPGYRSAHNLNYWRHGSYLGFGPSAHSFWNGSGDGQARRWWNVRSVNRYNSLVASGQTAVESEELLTTDLLVTERLFLGLRSDGVNVREFRREFGNSVFERNEPLIRDLVRENLVTFSDDLLRLTPRGYLLCDEVSARLSN